MACGGWPPARAPGVHAGYYSGSAVALRRRDPARGGPRARGLRRDDPGRRAADRRAPTRILDRKWDRKSGRERLHRQRPVPTGAGVRLDRWALAVRGRDACGRRQLNGKTLGCGPSATRSCTRSAAHPPGQDPDPPAQAPRQG